MKHPKLIGGMVLALVLLPLGIVAAQDQQAGTTAAGGAPVNAPQAQERRAHGAAQPSAKGANDAQQTRKPTRRRSVQQIIVPAPSPAPSATYGPTLRPGPAATYGPTVSSAPTAAYGPTLSAAPAATYGPALASPAPTPAIPAPGVLPVAPGPAPLNSCIGNHCTDAAGNSYNAGTGNAAVNSQGRLCNRVGNTVQCF